MSSQPNLVRYYRGYSTITQQQSIGWRTYHSIQLAVTRRMRNGLSFGANDTIQLSDKQFVAPRLQHNDDGTITTRERPGDGAGAVRQQFSPARHVARAYFTWDLPDYRSTDKVGRVVGFIVNDWSLSGIWNGVSGSPYNVELHVPDGRRQREPDGVA